ncbi:hypothetical protein AVEN_250272-1 [Araneus ventricosus]|uniref:Uncharacterized protein n=1 Tax=Araneus ventricosus TaxID=182803 RepID=A0A4Y2SLJ4_ARAVE|nr:hypothetical protein AVEN_184594-1 [Araneus ventricosus]GBN88087.1 hypothetical protein AVEN_170713-1 [Araneus ventricosus]GBN88099.1 hypothetical protein AVEN_4750-1 [Araneus ventricosus]GBN88118.1 hypothetical protein AVEN_250272-1 [Araneus ventricosus]
MKGGCTRQEVNTETNPHIHPTAKKPYQESDTKRVHHPLAKRMGQWRNRQECSQRFAESQDNSYSMAKSRNNFRHGTRPISRHILNDSTSETVIAET